MTRPEERLREIADAATAGPWEARIVGKPIVLGGEVTEDEARQVNAKFGTSANAASLSTPEKTISVPPHIVHRYVDSQDRKVTMFVADITGGTRADAVHIAAWSPPVAKAALDVIASARSLIQNLSLSGCCPAANCDSEDPTGLDGARDPEPHSEGCAWVAACAAIAAWDSVAGGEK